MTKRKVFYGALEGAPFKTLCSPVATIYTIGHSTRTFDELVAALQAQGIRTLVDIRSFPMSRRLPHFNRESLEVELPKHGIDYVWMKELGGRRKKIRNDSPNTGLRNDSFRNYADYMLTPEFAQAIQRLLEIAKETADPSTTSANSGRLARDDKREEYWQHCHHVCRAGVLPMSSHVSERLPHRARPHRPAH